MQAKTVTLPMKTGGQIRAVKTSYSALQLFDFAQFYFINVSEYTEEKILSFSSCRPH